MRAVFVALAALALVSSAYAAPTCPKKPPCGHACYENTHVCHLKPAVGPYCVGKTKRCGHTCIPNSQRCG